MSLKKAILYHIIRFQRYVIKRKFISILTGPLKGYQWSTAFNYNYLTGDYEDAETMKIFLSWLKEDTVFYDVGANIGYYSIIANQVITRGRIYSFEPIPLNLSIYRDHLRLNKKKIKGNNIELMPFAISDAEKEVIFSNNEYSEGNTYVDSEMPEVSIKKIRVKCHSLDDLLEQGFRPPNILKLDVEGAEYDVLRGAANVIRKYKPRILLATHDCHIQGIQKMCVDYLKKLGYDLRKMPGLNKTMEGLDDYIAIPKDSTTGNEGA